MEGLQFDLSRSKAIAVEAARHWGLDLGPAFSLSNVSYVAPAGDAVVKVAWAGDDESLHEPDALSLWNGNGAVRLLGRFGRALLEERAVPGDDLSALPESEATAVAIDVASRLWRTGKAPFRPVMPEVRRWLERAADEGSELVPHAQQLLPRSASLPTGSFMGTFITTTSFGTVTGMSQSTQSPTWPNASTTYRRSFGTPWTID